MNSLEDMTHLLVEAEVRYWELEFFIYERLFYPSKSLFVNRIHQHRG